jgi:hypothetical protein
MVSLINRIFHNKLTGGTFFLYKTKNDGILELRIKFIIFILALKFYKIYDNKFDILIYYLFMKTIVQKYIDDNMDHSAEINTVLEYYTSSVRNYQ